MKNVIVNFVDWYKEYREGKESNYCKDFCKGNREIFITTLSEYAVEFAMAHRYNPFLVETGNIDPFLSKLKSDVYMEDNSFAAYSASRSHHMPRALLGDKNYLKFLSEWNAEKQKSASLKTENPLKQAENLYHYEQDELRKNFYFRLITQDRYYEFLHFPVSVLKKLFYENDREEFFDSWVNKQIDSIAIHIGKTDNILFKDLASLDIQDDGSVLINGKSKLHTTIAGQETRGEVNTNTLQNIVIDHVVPFEHVLLDLQSQLTALQTVHNVLANINKGRISNKEDLINAGNYMVSNVEFASEELDALEKDLNLIAANIQLQLMDKYENLHKKTFSKATNSK
jgi:hypothetical protein